MKNEVIKEIIKKINNAHTGRQLEAALKELKEAKIILDKRILEIEKELKE